MLWVETSDWEKKKTDDGSTHNTHARLWLSVEEENWKEKKS